MANLIPKIAKMLGMELGEKFKIDIRGNDIFQITESGIWMRKGIDKEEWVEKPFEFVMLCNGDAEIIKLHYRPDYRQMYWTFGLKDGIWVVVPREWEDYPAEILLADKGWTYRTKEEAQDALPKVAAEMGVEYKL